MNTSTATARALVSALLAAGVRDVVIAPGSRSAPLTYAVAEAAAAGLLDVRVRIDEREAGFLALGIAKGRRAAGTERPVAVVTTSGSAVANLHPAVLEASYGYLPLLALTADRPARLRATGANQTIDDQSLVLSDVRERFDLAAGQDAPELAPELAATAVALSLGEGFAGDRPPGPVQLNIQFDVPLVPDAADPADWWEPGRASRAGSAEPAAVAQPGTHSGGTGAEGPAVREPVPLDSAFVRIVLPALAGSVAVLGGDAFGLPAQRLGRLLEQHRVPVLAEPSSPLRGSPHRVPDHTRVLDARGDLVERITDLIVLGKPTLYRQDQRLLARPGLRVHRVQPDLDQVAEEEWRAALAQALPEVPAGREAWTAAWLDAARAVHAEQHPVPPDDRAGTPRSGPDEGSVALDGPAPLTGETAAAAVAGVPGTVYIGSSNAVRYLDRALAPGTAVEVFASRGLAGIDGLVSTAIGFAAGSGRPVRLLLGDVSLLHGIGGLLREAGEPLPPVQIFVLNDDGGAIFAGLEHGRPHLAAHFPRFFATAHGRTFAELARGYGWPHTECRTTAAIGAAVAAGEPGVYEIPITPVLG